MKYASISFFSLMKRLLMVRFCQSTLMSILFDSYKFAAEQRTTSLSEDFNQTNILVSIRVKKPKLELTCKETWHSGRGIHQKK